MAMMVKIGPIIKAGDSLSQPLDVSSGGLYRVVMPIEWNSAPITFQLSYNGVDFFNVCDRDGHEVHMGCTPQSVVPIGEYLFYIHSVKIRSGMLRSPIVQQADRTFAVVLETKTAFELATTVAKTQNYTRVEK